MTFGISEEEEGAAVEVAAREAAGAGVCQARRGTEASTMVISKQHFHPRRFIDLSTPLLWAAPGRAGATLKKRLAGDPTTFAEGDYTRDFQGSCS
jgi:hypothetical protein